ncbi:Nucleolar_GAR1-like protein [Hexamita inflata]|uniref:H/ACA ribonucleoprotein complex subunit n=1 Tax=Hexamita inflata TaxID=28002 RepID=A0AA86V4G4_9EUKA|nr:Nucleolar GAR1-like protein [Hexamita inflata]CAI9976136.1 Nucleolar GAR1-like protein [Hexamita inflata]
MSYRGQERKEETGAVQFTLSFMHICYDKKQNLAVCKCADNKLVPKFNSFVYDKSEKPIGKIEEVFGPLMQFYIAFKGVDGYNVEKISSNTSFGIRMGQLIPVERFKPVVVVKRAHKEKKDDSKGRVQRGAPQRFDKKPFNRGPDNRFGGNSQGGNRFGGDRQGGDRPQGGDRFGGSQGGRFGGNNQGGNRFGGQSQGGRFGNK